MIEERPGGTIPEQDTQLRTKLTPMVDTYLRANSPTSFPNPWGRTITIRLDCVESPSSYFDDISYMAQQLAGFDIRLHVLTTN